MATQISLYGIARPTQRGPGRSWYSDVGSIDVTLEEDISEDEAVQLVLKQLAQEGLTMSRKPGQMTDRITVRTLGVGDAGIGRPVQPRDPTTGHFMSYDQYGRQLWQQSGSKGAPRTASGRYMSYAEYGRQQSAWATGSRRLGAVGRTQAAETIRRSIADLPQVQERTGSQWRKTQPRRVNLGYDTQLENEL